MPADSQMDLFSPAAPPGRPVPVRRFLDWDRPLLEQAAAWLLEQAGDTRPIDLSHLLVIVPTKNAGRRLREMLANLADERGTAVIPPLTAPPSILTSVENGAALIGRPVAGELEALANWIALLQRMDLTEFRALFPLDPPAQDFRWARATARDLTALRRTLGESGLGLTDVSRRLPDGHEEMERWRDLARLETTWLDWLDRSLGKCDREMARALSSQQAGNLPPGIREIVMIGTPDPFPLALDALETHAAAGLPVTVTIYAPDSLSHAFDEWGRPLAGYWLAAPLAIPAFRHSIRVVANPDDLISRVVEMTAAISHPPDTLAIGAVDPELAPLLESALSERGVAAFLPEGGRIRQEGFYHLLRILSQLVERPVFESLREWLRVPEIDHWLASKIAGWNSRGTLWALDESHRNHLAVQLPEVMDFLRADSAAAALLSESKSVRFALAAAAVSETTALLRRIGRGPLRESLPTALAEIVGARHREGADGTWAEKVIEAAAPVLMGGLDQLAHLAAAGIELDAVDQLALLADLTGEVTISGDRPPGAIELQGWLELLWEDAPHLIVAGLNDGIVPDAIVGDAYLPENLRSLRTLRLKSNDDRLVRDLYLLRALLEARRMTGRIDLLVQKSNADGDPLRPSRLLFRCDDAELPGRVAHLFREIEAPGTQDSWSPGFALIPGLERAGAPEKPFASIAVTAFAGYLASPFHFWAAQQMRMRGIDADKAEMDDLDFGVFCHDVLERFGNDSSARKWSDPEKIEAFLLSTADEIARERYGKRPGLALRIQIDSAKHRLGAAAEHEARERRDGWEIVGVEMNLRDAYPLSLGGLEVSGKIDRVERNGDLIRVLDYKTSDKRHPSFRDHVIENRLGAEPEWPPPYAFFDHADFSARHQSSQPREKTYRFKKLQLPLYALAVSQAHPEAEIHCGYFHLTKALGDVGLDDWCAGPELLAAARICAEGVIADVAAGRFDRIYPPQQAEYDDLAALHLGAPNRTLDLSQVGRGDDSPRMS